MTTYLAIGIDYYSNSQWHAFVSFTEPQAIADVLYKQGNENEPDEVVLITNGPGAPTIVGTFVKDTDYTFTEDDQ